MNEAEIEPGAVTGFCDGAKGQDVYGWAWRPDYPDLPVAIEMWIDGVFHAETVASLYRPDLRAAGVGHGRYGWRIPFAMDPDRSDPLEVVIRLKSGAVLPGGSFQIAGAASTDVLEDLELDAFVAAALGRGAATRATEASQPAPQIHFLLHCAGAVETRALGAPEYSYAFVLKAFAPLLAKLGQVHILEHPETEADALYAEHIARGETSVLLSFAPPHRVVLGLRCPVVPVVAWEFPTLPARVWGEDRRHDWRFVLRQTGRCIMLSRFAAEAVRATMGEAFPVAAIPAPVFDRYADLQTLAAPASSTSIEVDGFVYDTRGRGYEPGAASPPLPKAPGEEDGSEDGGGEALPADVTLHGVVFTAVFSPKDGRKNWPDMVTAFIQAHRDTPDAVLVLKMVGADAALWWWELHDILGRLPAFACRLVVIHGYLDEERYNRLVAATHWVANASHAEGLCLPLVEFLSAGRPAISPRHTAMLDYIDENLALIVESDEEYCGFPHDPDNALTTTRHRVSWPGLVDAFAEAYRLTTAEPDRYGAMATAARAGMKRFCSDEAVAAQLDGFLGLGLERGKPAATPSDLFETLAA